ncbi:MAG: 1-acyl-sn-glycerol-3-phosphate acyltransferase [Clostridia bacterium]|nr:1-acyl-sn-glycerol-3-phosphate acyltransferase [Clostridia bacterium]
MQVKVTKLPYNEVLKRKTKKAKPAKKPNIFFRTLLKLVSLPDLMAARFTCTKKGLEKLDKKQPCFILMNHSSFIDLEIVTSVFYPRPLNIVATWDAMLGKNWLMRQIGCMPTIKFMASAKLIRDMQYCLKKLKTSVVMYPEVGYTFDGTTTTLPESLGKCVKLLGVPLVSVITHGAHLRQPLFNELRKRNVFVNAEVEYLLSPDQIKQMSPDEINRVILEKFSFNEYRYQSENGVRIDHPERAVGLNRILYKCPHCLAEGQTEGKGATLICKACGKEYELTETGEMKALDGETEIESIPQWYAWERKCVKEELEGGRYELNADVDIMMMVDTSGVYDIGSGKLTHGENGFRLVSDDGQLDFTQSPTASYSVNSDLYWYEMGDVVCVGDLSAQYYCFPKNTGDIVVKARLAAEELFKLKKTSGKVN